MTEVELSSEHYLYNLYQVGDKLKLVAVCGTVAIYDIAIWLTEEEATRYKTEGEPFIRSLALNISSFPSNYANRRIA